MATSREDARPLQRCGWRANGRLRYPATYTTSWDTTREFAPEFKREAVALLESSGRPLMQVAGEVGISPSMLRNWRTAIHTGVARSRAVAAGVPPLPSPADQAGEIARLKRDLDRTRMERDVLKKAIGIFAEVPR